MNTERYELNKQLAQMLKGGVIMDVTTPEQARIAEEAGACAVMALERIPADIRAAGGVSRMSDPKMIKGIQEAVSRPVHCGERRSLPGCRCVPHRQAQIQCAVCVRRKGSWGGAPPHQRGSFHDPYQGRAWNRGCCAGSTPYAHDESGNRQAELRAWEVATCEVKCNKDH